MCLILKGPESPVTCVTRVPRKRSRTGWCVSEKKTCILTPLERNRSPKVECNCGNFSASHFLSVVVPPSYVLMRCRFTRKLMELKRQGPSWQTLLPRPQGEPWPSSAWSQDSVRNMRKSRVSSLPCPLFLDGGRVNTDTSGIQLRDSWVGKIVIWMQSSLFICFAIISAYN